jgi:uncharacterized membrane protein
MEGRRVNQLVTALAIAALLGSGVIGGVFFAFSSFIMKSLARLPSSEGIAAMQSINVVVLNRSFLGVFMGTAAIALLLIALSLGQWGTGASPLFFTGAVLYFVGTFVVTIAGNVPLNDRLAAAVPDENGVLLWEHYLERWTQFNTLRTIAAIAAALTFTLGLIGGANA